MKKISRLLAALMAVLFALSAFAAVPNPKSVVESYLKAIKISDVETIEKVYSGDAADILLGGIVSGSDLTNTVAKMTGDFTYKISKPVIKGDKATVKVTISTYDFGKLYSDIFSKYLSKIFEDIFEDYTQEDYIDLMSSIMAESIKDVKKSFTGSANLTLTKTSDGWMVDDVNENSEFLNIITGRLFDFLSRLMDVMMVV